MTEIAGYDGPLYMTYPTKAICPSPTGEYQLLEVITSPLRHPSISHPQEDFRKVTTDKNTQQGPYTTEDIKNCMKKGHSC